MFPRDPNEPRVIRWVRNPSVRRNIILLFLWTFALTVLFYFHAVLLPFAVAVLLAFIIEPAVTAAAGRSVFGKRISRILVILSIYAVVFLLVYLFARSAVPQIGREIARIGAEAAALVSDLEPHTVMVLDKLEALAIENHIPLDRQEIETFVRTNIKSVTAAVGANANNIFTLGKSLVTGLVQVIFGSFLVLMLTAFLSVDRARIERYAASMVPPEYRPSYDTIVGGITRGLAGVVRGQVLICLTNGVLTFIGLWLLDVKFPFVLAIVAAVFSLIPIFGSILSTIPIVAVALTDSMAKGVFALLWIIGIHIIEANLLNPKIMGDAAKIHPVLVVFSLIAGERTAGLVGALFAVPIASVVVTLFKFMHQRAMEAGTAADRRTTSDAALELERWSIAPPPPPPLEARPPEAPPPSSPLASPPPAPTAPAEREPLPPERTPRKSEG